MQYPSPPKGKLPKTVDGKPASLAVRINRAANELNPFLIVLAIGLLILNLTLYLGMSVSRQSTAWAANRSFSAPADSAPATSFTGSGGTRY